MPVIIIVLYILIDKWLYLCNESFWLNFFYSIGISSYAAYYGFIYALVYTLANIKVFLTLVRFCLIGVINFQMVYIILR